LNVIQQESRSGKKFFLLVCESEKQVNDMMARKIEILKAMDIPFYLSRDRTWEEREKERARMRR